MVATSRTWMHAACFVLFFVVRKQSIGKLLSHWSQVTKDIISNNPAFYLQNCNNNLKLFCFKLWAWGHYYQFSPYPVLCITSGTWHMAHGTRWPWNPRPLRRDRSWSPQGSDSRPNKRAQESLLQLHRVIRFPHKSRPFLQTPRTMLWSISNDTTARMRTVSTMVPIQRSDH